MSATTLTEEGSVVLLERAYTFAGAFLNLDRWRPAYVSRDLLGLEIR